MSPPLVPAVKVPSEVFDEPVPPDAMKKLYSVEREYPVALSALWSAWMDADALQNWYSPTDLKVVPGSVTSEPVVGGWWTVGVDVSQFGFNAYFFGTYSELKENKRIVHSMNYTQDENEF